ncbi:MAG: hypothetical protein H0V15_06125 [Solirubrobacterales bacterium]|nr:hypothetical protein [Solirubrobacterales bacterium]
MRDALNNNPMVQIGALGGMLVIVGLLMMTRMGGGSESAEQQDATAATAVSLPGAPPVGSTPSAPTATVSPEALKPGPGLPAPAADAIKGGGSLVLLIVSESAIDDRLVEDSVTALSSRPGVSVIVVPADEIARYSRITQSVGVNRTPALVVVRPKAASRTPEATVSYGFRDSASVIQAVDDAVYSGKDNIPYHPG